MYYVLWVCVVCVVCVSVCDARLVLQGLGMSSRLMAVVGLLMTITATLLMGDWQAIRHDPCNEASLFHHPDLLHTYTSQMDSSPGAGGNLSQPDQLTTAAIQCEGLNLSLAVQQHLSSTSLNIFVYPNIVTGDVMSYGCELVDSCPYCSVDWNEAMKTYTATPTCLHLHINSQENCLERTPMLPWQQESHPLSTSYLCTTPKSLFTYCLQSTSSISDNVAAVQTEEEMAMVADIHSQSLHIVESHVNYLAEQACQHHSGGGCHWNPSSSISHKNCEDCPPICRHRTNYLEFSQFTIAAAILLVSVPVARVPITSIISDLVNSDQQVCGGLSTRLCSLTHTLSVQGVVMGLAQALNAVARSVGPLWCKPSKILCLITM